MQPDSLTISSTGPGAILALVRSGQATTRAALMATTGLSRSTIGQRLELLIQAGYLRVTSTTVSTGGRPVEALQVNPDYGLLLLAAVGASGFRVAITDFCGRMLEVHSETSDITLGPDVTLSRIRTLFLQLLKRAPQGCPVRGIGIGLPGPIDFQHKTIVQPPIMRGWDNFSVPGFFASDFPVPVLMDNDVNLMALGEHRFSYADIQDLLYLKLGTGIGSGIVMSGKIQRGALGAAGDLGHWFLPDWRKQETALRSCRCGKQGCLEAYSSGWALCEEWQVESVRMLMLHENEPDLQKRLQAAGVHHGEALAMAINLLNPERVIVGGELINDALLTSLRETVYLRSGALSTRSLQIDQGPLGENAGLYGGVALVTDYLLSPGLVDQVCLR